MNHGLGAIKSPRDLRNYRISKLAKAIDLPTSFELPHPHIKNQGSVSSCVAHSVSSLLETHDNVNYSTGWIYGYRPNDYYQGQGMYTSEALKTINKVGYVKHDVLDVNLEIPEAIEVVNDDIDFYKEIASQKKIGKYAELRTFEEIKQSIYTLKTPAIVCINIDKDGLQLSNDYVAYVPKEPCGGHAVMCYGWNEKGLLIQNSWGEEWGNRGTFILPESYSFYEAWAIEIEIKEEPKKEEPDNKEEKPVEPVEPIEPVQPNIEKPNFYWLRELIMVIIKLLNEIFNK